MISGADYQHSLEGLKRFVEEVEVIHLQTLEDLSAVASLVGHDLYVVAATKGKKIEKKTEHVEPSVSGPISRIEREYVFTHGLADREIIVTASKGHSLLALDRFCGFQRYRSAELSVRLPSDRDIAIGEKPNVDEQSLYVLDFRGARRAYHPVKEPDSPEIQRSNHSGQNHQEKPVCLPEARAFDLSTKNDQLLSQQRVFRKRFGFPTG